MPKGKGSPRAQSAAADAPLRRGRRDEEPTRAKPAPEKIVRAAARESEILPGVPLS